MKPYGLLLSSRWWKPTRWNDWLLLAAITCFVGGALVNLMMAIFVEQPLGRELQASYVNGESRPGHFLPAGFTYIARMILNAAAVVLGLLLATVGSCKIPRTAHSSRKLREVCWLGFALWLTATVGFAML